jgi:hypothetical protein
MRGALVLWLVACLIVGASVLYERFSRGKK